MCEILEILSCLSSCTQRERLVCAACTAERRGQRSGLCAPTTCEARAFEEVFVCVEVRRSESMSV